MQQKLHEYQTRAVETALKAGRHIFNFEMGLGKTGTAIETLRQLNINSALVVCPALVRTNWQREFDKWWPAHPETGTIFYNNTRTKGLTKAQKEQKEQSYAAKIQIVSPELVSNLVGRKYDAVVLDELHLFKDGRAGYSTTVREICAEHAGPILGLTGTLMPDQIKDVWHQVHILWPNRFGKYLKQFADYYSNNIGDDYGPKWRGINELHIEELRERLAAVSTRVTRAEVAHLLPAMDVSLLPVSSGSEGLYTLADFEKFGEAKIHYAAQWARESQVAHKCILTHRKETAREIAEQVNGYVITGEQSIEERLAIIDKAKSEQSATIVATMHSIGIGIDLTHFTSVLFAELYWRPATMVQAIGRFSRLSGRSPATVQLLVIAGTLDEKVGQAFVDKMDAINKAIPPTATESGLVSLWNSTEEGSDIFAELSAALGTQHEFGLVEGGLDD